MSAFALGLGLLALAALMGLLIVLPEAMAFFSYMWAHARRWLDSI
jgi:hypothetical protein